MAGAIFYCIQAIVLIGLPEGQDHIVSAVLPHAGLLAEASGYSASGTKSVYDSLLLYHIVQALQTSAYGKLRSKWIGITSARVWELFFYCLCKTKPIFLCILPSCFTNGFLYPLKLCTATAIMGYSSQSSWNTFLLSAMVPRFKFRWNRSWFHIHTLELMCQVS